MGQGATPLAQARIPSGTNKLHANIHGIPISSTEFRQILVTLQTPRPVIHVSSNHRRIIPKHPLCGGPGSVSRYSDWLRAGRSGDRISVASRFSAPVQTGPGSTQSPVRWVPGLSRGVKSGRGVLLTTHSLLVPWSRKSRAIPLFPLWAVRPLQSLSACTSVHFTFFFTHCVDSYFNEGTKPQGALEMTRRMRKKKLRASTIFSNN